MVAMVRPEGFEPPRLDGPGFKVRRVYQFRQGRTYIWYDINTTPTISFCVTHK